MHVLCVNLEAYKLHEDDLMQLHELRVKHPQDVLTIPHPVVIGQNNALREYKWQTLVDAVSNQTLGLVFLRLEVCLAV